MKPNEMKPMNEIMKPIIMKNINNETNFNNNYNNNNNIRN